jgi:heptosyltransferase-2/heptosyltransferase-3
MSATIRQARDLMLPVAARLAHYTRYDPDDTILILQPDHLGDILLAQPAVRQIRRAFPMSRLVAVVGPWSSEIASMAWPVDDMVEVEFPGFTRAHRRNPADPYLYLRSASERLRELKPRAAVVLRPDAWWAAWLAALTSPVVVTSDDPRTAIFGTLVAHIDPTGHAATRAAQIAGRLTGMPVDVDRVSSRLRIDPNPEAASEAERILFRHDIQRQFAVIHPGSGAAVKEWPVHRWGAIAAKLLDRGLDVVVTGSRSERAVAEAVVHDASHVAVIAGETSVPVLAEVLRGARLVLGPDCGPLHLAVAVNAPSVHLFGPSDSARYGPWGPAIRHVAVSAGWTCPRCGDLSAERQAGCGCMIAISPSAVIDVANGLLDAE